MLQEIREQGWKSSRTGVGKTAWSILTPKGKKTDLGGQHKGAGESIKYRRDPILVFPLGMMEVEVQAP